MIDHDKIKSLIREFLVAIGENPDREGLIDTPRRVADLCQELLSIDKNKSEYTVFDSGNYGGMVLVKDIEFSSLCEHHLIPFIGAVHLAYIPGDKIIGLSKIARIVEKHSKKLQLQERLAQDIISDIETSISPKGVAIYIEARHLCMNIRGIRKRRASTVTTLFSGEFDDFKTQELFLRAVANKNEY